MLRYAGGGVPGFFALLFGKTFTLWEIAAQKKGGVDELRKLRSASGVISTVSFLR
jgi:hypothetical protein